MKIHIIESTVGGGGSEMVGWWQWQDGGKEGVGLGLVGENACLCSKDGKSG